MSEAPRVRPAELSAPGGPGPLATVDEPPYGWVVVGATATALGVVFGVVYAFGAFFAALQAQFQAPRAEVSLVFGLAGLTYFLLGPLGGLLADRHGPRVVCSVGMVLVAAGLAATSLAGHIQTVQLCYTLGVGVGVALVYTPAMASVPPWFTRRRGLAAGLASAGIGGGTLLVPLLASALIGPWGWRAALGWLAGGTLLLGLAATLLLRRAPMLGQAAAVRRPGAAAPSPAAGAQASPAVVPAGLTLGQAVRTRPFLWLYAMALLSGPAMFVPFAHITPAARDLGVSQSQAAGLVGLIGIGSLSGRFLIGYLADRLGRARTLALGVAALAAGFGLWALAQGYAGLALFALWHGLAYGGIVSLMPALTMDLFGGRAVSAILGTLYTAAALGNLAGPWLAGALFDARGGYGLVIAGCALLGAAATVAAWPLTRDARP